MKDIALGFVFLLLMALFEYGEREETTEAAPEAAA